MTTYLTKRGKITYLLLFIAMLLVVVPLSMSAIYNITDHREFQSIFGMHVDRASEYSDPQMIKDSLTLALEGIDNLGLEPGDSYRILSFIDTGFTRVETYILEIQSALIATDEVLLWIDDMHSSSITNEIGTDLYTEKVKALRYRVSRIYEHHYRAEFAWWIKHKSNWTYMLTIPLTAMPVFLLSMLFFYTGHNKLEMSDYDITRNSLYNRDQAVEEWKQNNKLFGRW